MKREQAKEQVDTWEMKEQISASLLMYTFYKREINDFMRTRPCSD